MFSVWCIFLKVLRCLKIKKLSLYAILKNQNVWYLLITKINFFREGEGGGGGGRGPSGAGGGGGGRRAPSLRLVNGRATTGVGLTTSSTESVRSPHHHLGHPNNNNNNNFHNSTNKLPRLNKDDSIKISIENTNTCTDSLVTALDDETLLITDFLCDTSKFHLYFLPSFMIYSFDNSN